MSLLLYCQKLERAVERCSSDDLQISSKSSNQETGPIKSTNHVYKSTNRV